MHKVLIIGWKDFTLILRDRAALLLMLAAPFVLTLGLGFVSGRFSGTSSSGLSHIPVVIVNQDAGQLGRALVNVFSSPDLAGLVAPAGLVDVPAARRQVEGDQAAAAVIIPPGFTASVLPDQATGQTGPAAAIEVYSGPARPLGASVIRAIVASFLSQADTGTVSAQVVIEQLLAHGLLTPLQLGGSGGSAVSSVSIVQHALAVQTASPLVTIRRTTGLGTSASCAPAPCGPAPDLDVLSIFAPGMALMFLMYTVSYGGRNLLAERTEGTLPRLLITPTSAAQVLGGKVFGIFLTGVAQVTLLVVTSSLLFHLKWGSPLGLAALILAVVAAATGWGILLAAFARTPAQVASVGSALMLVFGILSGLFVPLTAFPGWLQLTARLTPNAWGLDAFTSLASGGVLSTIAPSLGALLMMAAVLFAAAVLVFQRTQRLSAQ